MGVNIFKGRLAIYYNFQSTRRQYRNTVFLKYVAGVVEIIAAISDMKLDSFTATPFRLSFK
jgi:hypothetical protein